MALSAAGCHVLSTKYLKCALSLSSSPRVFVQEQCAAVTNCIDLWLRQNIVKSSGTFKTSRYDLVGGGGVLLHLL